jgi:subtilisin family serine protease
MTISRKTCLFLMLVFISIYASWQGVGASYAVTENSGSTVGVSARVAAPLQNTGPSEAENTEEIVPPSDVVYYQHSPGVSESKSSWALARINALPLTWSTDVDSRVLVAVLDTGIDKYHEDLTDRVVAEIDFSGSLDATDIYGHGTAIAGIIAANAANDLGVMGLAPESRLINVKVAGDDGRCQLSALAEGIIWAVDYGAKVINISIELKEASSVLEEAIDYAWEHGALVIAAAGNDGDSRPVYPAAYGHCLAVTAVRENDALAPLANYGDWVDCAAPGLDIYTTLPDSQYGYKHGTSFAAAYVSGLAALLFTVATDTSGDGYLNDEVLRAIESGCEVIDIDGSGRGIINVAASVAILALDNGSLP